jgi:hypothetical protein
VKTGSIVAVVLNHPGALFRLAGRAPRWSALPGETVSGPAARGSFTDAKKSCGGDLGETKTGEGIAVVRRGHQVSRRACVIAATIRIVEAPQQRVQDGQKLGGDRAIVLALGPRVSGFYRSSAQVTIRPVVQANKHLYGD